MNTAEFWINKIDDPDKIIPHDKNLNEKIYNKFKNKEFYKNLDNKDSYGVITKNSLMYMDKGEQEHSIVREGDPIIIKEYGEWSYIITKICEGWIKKSNIKKTKTLDYKLHGPFEKFTQRNLINELFSWLGEPHALLTPGLTDCAWYVTLVLKKFGLDIPHTTQLMDYALNHKPKDDAKPGDILIMENHAMIYLGEENGNKYVISNLASYYENDILIKPKKVCISNINTAKRATGYTWYDSIYCALEYASS